MAQRELTAHHEAGHAVAALMRGAGELLSITIKASGDAAGRTVTRHKVFDAAFVTFAGPWAEARAQWPLPTLDGEDDMGCAFGDYLTTAWWANVDGDGDTYEDNLAAEVAMYGGQWPAIMDPRKREEGWAIELEDSWPVIQAIADLLLRGECVDHTRAYGLLARHWEGAA
jgi:hypothetical protein